MAFIIGNYDIKFIGSDNINSQVIKSICELVAKGRTRIGMILDHSAIESDKEWL